MTPTAVVQELSRLLGLDHPPVAVTFHEHEPGERSRNRPAAEPAGCCFWAKAERGRIDTTAPDHAHCSVGSYTHGLISLADAAGGADTAALVASGWVTETDLSSAPRVEPRPAAITYEPLADAEEADVVLVRLTVSSLMSLQGACPQLSLVTKPQCQIVALACAGAVAVSPGCAVSRVRTGLPTGELTCALPAGDLADIVARLTRSLAADAAVSAFADADIRENFAPARREVSPDGEPADRSLAGS
jgi:uncharacterized protein (DUF169 family)